MPLCPFQAFKSFNSTSILEQLPNNFCIFQLGKKSCTKPSFAKYYCKYPWGMLKLFFLKKKNMFYMSFFLRACFARELRFDMLTHCFRLGFRKKQLSNLQDFGSLVLSRSGNGQSRGETKITMRNMFLGVREAPTVGSHFTHLSLEAT